MNNALSIYKIQQKYYNHDDLTKSKLKRNSQKCALHDIERIYNNLMCIYTSGVDVRIRLSVCCFSNDDSRIS